MLMLFFLSVQTVFAVDVPLKSGTPGPGDVPNGYAALRSYSLQSVSVNPVNASLNETELVLSFSNHVGIAHVTVEDQNGSVVYQDVVNTNLTLESVIETSGWDSGNYTVRISYGSTKLSGTFQL